MKHYLLLIIAMISICHMSAATAVRVTAIYHASVPVASQSAEDRTKALPQALAQVLIKVTGNSHILDNPNLKAVKVSNLLQEFSYSTNNYLGYPFFLEAQFDGGSINKLLRNATAPIWGVNRPLLLAWVAAEIPNQSAEIIGNGSKNQIRDLIKTRADARGLPVLFPLMDVTDLKEVNVNHLVTMATPVLQSAAKRYSSDGILVIRIFQLPDGFSSQTKLVLGIDQWDWTHSGKSLADVLNTVIDSVTYKLAGKYATVVSNNIQSKLALKIIGITEEKDFAQMVRYVKYLPPVAGVQIMHIAGDEVTLNLSLRGTQQAFSQILSVGNKLKALPTAGESTLIYQWNH